MINEMSKTSSWKLRFQFWFILIFILFIAIIYLSFEDSKIFPSVKKVMFIAHTETMGGKGVYEFYIAMKDVGHDVKIIAIPNYYYRNLISDIDREFFAKFPREDVIYPCGKKEPYDKCESIESYQPDYIFIQNPYNTFDGSILEPLFDNKSLRRITKKLAYIVYGPHIFHQSFINDKNLPNLVDYVFVDSFSTKDIYKKYYNFPEKRVIVSGYQTYKSIRDKLELGDNKHKVQTVLWLPRWFLSFWGRDLHEGGSTFLNYHYFFYNYALANPNINFIIRPHILLYTDSIKQNHLSAEDLDKIFVRFQSLPNITISKHENRPLVDDVLASDVVISDGSSALAEVVVADKPIIYLSNGMNNEFNSNDLSKALSKYIYFAYNPNDIVRHLEYIEQNNYQPFDQQPECTSIFCMLQRVKCRIFNKICNRDDFKKNLDPIENPAKFIADYVLYN